MSEECRVKIKHTEENNNFKNMGRTDKVNLQEDEELARKLKSIRASMAKHQNIIRTREKKPMHGNMLMSRLDLKKVILYLMSK